MFRSTQFTWTWSSKETPSRPKFSWFHVVFFLNFSKIICWYITPLSPPTVHRFSWSPPPQLYRELWMQSCQYKIIERFSTLIYNKCVSCFTLLLPYSIQNKIKMMSFRFEKTEFASSVHSGKLLKDKVNHCILFSLHIRSMWQTICYAVASWSGWKFGSKIPVYPFLGFGPEYTLPLDSPHHPRNENLARTWHFGIWLPQNTPPPSRKFKFRQILALRDIWVLITPEYPPSPKNLILAQDVCGD